MLRHPDLPNLLVDDLGGLFRTTKNGDILPRNAHLKFPGYKRVKVGGKLHYVHRLVAQTYLPNPHNLTEVNHINGDKADNRVCNLEWVSREQNMQHAVLMGLLKPSPPPKKTWEILHMESGATFITHDLHLTSEDFGVKYGSLWATLKYTSTKLPIKLMGVVDETSEGV